MIMLKFNLSGVKMVLTSKLTIQEIESSNLCTGCGTCAGICPNSSIDLLIDDKKGLYIPKINFDTCDECGMCLKACPGSSLDICDFHLDNVDNKIDDFLLGEFKNCYLASSNEPDIRFNSSSGGTVTSLLIFALEQGLIDGALVTRMDKQNPLRSEPFIAKTKEEIIEASQSKYCPVSTNVLISEILKEDGRFAVVGLPCHIKGFKMAENINRKLKKKVVLHLGLFCSHTNSYSFTEFLIKKFNVEMGDIEEIRYRCRGWPGGTLIKLNDSTEKFIPNQSSFWNTISNGFFFTPHRCLLCDDVTSELADISFGDPWLPEIMNKEKVGISILISRSEIGQELVSNASLNGNIEITPLDSNDIIRSQKTFLHFKKVNLFSRVFISKLLGKNINYSGNPFKYSKFNYIIAIISLLNCNFCSNKWFFSIFKLIPDRFLEFYVGKFYNFYHKVIKKDFDKHDLSK